MSRAADPQWPVWSASGPREVAKPSKPARTSASQKPFCDRGYRAFTKPSKKPYKTRIVELWRGAEGFDFLGFHHRMVESRKKARSLVAQQVAVSRGHGLD